MIIGLISGILSSVLLCVAYQAMMEAVTILFPFFDLIPLWSIAWIVTAAFIVAGCLFGAIGGMISISKYLKKKEETSLRGKRAWRAAMAAVLTVVLAVSRPCSRRRYMRRRCPI